MSWTKLNCSCRLVQMIQRTVFNNWIPAVFTKTNGTSLSFEPAWRFHSNASHPQKVSSQYMGGNASRPQQGSSQCMGGSATWRPRWTRWCRAWNIQIRALHSDSNSSNNGIVMPQPLLRVTRFNMQGLYQSEDVKKSDLLQEFGLQNRDVRFTAQSSLYVREASIILRLQHIKAIINSDSLVLLDSDHFFVQQLLPEMQEKLQRTNAEILPFEFQVLEALLTKMLSEMDAVLGELDVSINEVLGSLLDSELFSVDRSQLHILLHLGKRLSEFQSLASDIEATLTETVDYEDVLADMYLTHYQTTGNYRDTEEVEEISNILEPFVMQQEHILSQVKQLKDLMDQSEKAININLDSQRNVMLRLGLQLEMGVFAATICGLMGLAFGMNLDSSLEDTTYAFWIVSGLMVFGCGFIWRRLLLFLASKKSPVFKAPPLKQLGAKIVQKAQKN